MSHGQNWYRGEGVRNKRTSVKRGLAGFQGASAIDKAISVGAAEVELGGSVLSGNTTQIFNPARKLK